MHIVLQAHLAEVHRRHQVELGGKRAVGLGLARHDPRLGIDAERQDHPVRIDLRLRRHRAHRLHLEPQRRQVRSCRSQRHRAAHLRPLAARGLLQDVTADLAQRLQKGPLTAYVGFDPTSDSLHVGNLVPVIGAAWLQRFGHTPIVLIGGGTGMVGDPSGKRSERPILPLDQIDRKARRFMGDGAAWNYISMQQAIADSGLEEKDVKNDRTGLIMGSGGISTRILVAAADTTREKGPKRVGPFAVPAVMASTNSATLATPFGIRGINYSISSACATSAHCIGNAAEMIQWGKQDVMFAGGARSWIGPFRFYSMPWAPCPQAIMRRPIRLREPMTRTAMAS